MGIITLLQGIVFFCQHSCFMDNIMDLVNLPLHLHNDCLYIFKLFIERYYKKSDTGNVYNAQFAKMPLQCSKDTPQH